MLGLARTTGITTFLFLQVACASQPHYSDVGVLVGEVRNDEVAAAAKYGDEHIGIRGRVMDKGLKSGKAAETELVGGLGGVWRSKTVRVNKNYGYLVLQSDANGTAKAVCLFESSMLDVLAPVQKGQLVNLRCIFSMVVGKPGDRAPVFYGCTVDA